ncbi:hypothetical protein [Acidithiobacillus ferriphilus]|uniref:hypothetical protein n=1 Tax=Acidithiobacillus ferriphilus TaxID=1689834 RepID=UPI002DBF38AC|nr:hypothetical protein [Acidithiobacillus ferriphilus]MEB8536553.1 hypothetical protein [Acidithiobacillus ferriphilus]
MTTATLLAEIEQADGEIWMDGDRLKFRAVPARLIPAIREHKAALLALLSAPAQDDYAAEERLAIQTEDSLPPDRGFDDIAGFEGMPDLAPSEHGAILHRLVYPPQESPAPALSATDATASPTMQHSADMAPQSAPATVSCGQCARFQPGPHPLGIGRCLATVTGQPPAGRSGDYRAAFPMAPRFCSGFLGSAS